jgi:DNA-binding transcriptional ArsR family regulator
MVEFLSRSLRAAPPSALVARSCSGLGHVSGRSGLTKPCLSTIIRHMPKYHDELDAVLRALADPTRRAVVERLAKSPAVVSELAAPFSMALPSLMQHLSILENAGVVTSEKHGRVRTVSLRPGALDIVHLWLGEQRTPAEHQADRLGIHLTITSPQGKMT